MFCHGTQKLHKKETGYLYSICSPTALLIQHGESGSIVIYLIGFEDPLPFELETGFVPLYLFLQSFPYNLWLYVFSFVVEPY